MWVRKATEFGPISLSASLSHSATSAGCMLRRAAAKQSRVLRKEMSDVSAAGAGPAAVWIANVDSHGINHIGDTTESTVTQTVSPSSTRAGVTRRRQYTSQHPTASSTIEASMAGVVANHDKPETNNASRMPGLNGPGGRTNGVGSTNTHRRIANSTPKPWTSVRVTMAVNSRIGSTI